jgi:hypothetical protein
VLGCVGASGVSGPTGKNLDAGDPTPIAAAAPAPAAIPLVNPGVLELMMRSTECTGEHSAVSSTFLPPGVATMAAASTFEAEDAGVRVRAQFTDVLLRILDVGHSDVAVWATDGTSFAIKSPR